MSYIKIGGAYFNRNRIKQYHIREIVDKDGKSLFQVRADTAIETLERDNEDTVSAS